MTGSYQFHPEAELDLDEIWELISSQNLVAANRVIEDVEEALENLASFPNQGFRRTDLTTRPLRFILVRDFLITYAPDE